MTTTDPWDFVRQRLVAELTELADGESLHIAEPDPPPEPKRSRRWFRGSAPRVGRYVQVSRLGDALLCECVSAAYADVTPEQGLALRARGWSDPARQPAGVNSENHVATGDVGDPGPAAALLVAALQTLGTGIPDDRWTWERIT